MDMTKSQKKLKSAGFTTILLTIITIVGCILTACQKTPEELIVQNKADDELQEAIVQTASPVSEASQTQEMAIETHITESDTNASNTVTVNIDADVTMPNISKIPIARVEETTLQTGSIEQIIKAFYGNVQLYDVISTKSDIQNNILLMQLKLTDDEAILNSSAADVTGSTDLVYLRSLINEQIEKLQKSLREAPDERPAINGYDDALTQRGLLACVDIGEDYLGYVNADISVSFGQQINLYAFGGDNPSHNRILKYEFSKPIELDINNSEFQNAKEMAERLIGDMGIDGIAMCEAYLSEDYTGIGNPGVTSEREFYVFCFSRVIGEGTVDYNFVSTMSNKNKSVTESYSRVLPYETIQVWVEGNVIRQFTWKVPMKVSEIVNNNVALAIDYKQAIELMKQQAFVQYLDVDDERGDLFSSYKVDINSMSLELVRIKERDTSTYLIVPAWVFHGGINAEVAQLYLEVLRPDNIELGDWVTANNFWLSGDTVMTINALDGSIIDIAAGY